MQLYIFLIDRFAERVSEAVEAGGGIPQLQESLKEETVARKVPEQYQKSSRKILHKLPEDCINET